MPIIEKRLKRAIERVEGLESSGIDMGKVRSLIQNIAKEAPSQKKDNILVAINKLEGYLDRMEQIAVKKTVVSAQRTERPEPDDEVRTRMGLDGPPVPEEVGEPPPTDGLLMEAADQAQVATGTKVESEETSSVAPFDEAKVRSDQEAVSALCEEVSSRGGDLSPIEPHLNAMSESAVNRDGVLFDQYRSIVWEWLNAYMGTLHREAFERTLSEFGKLVEDFQPIGREADIKDETLRVSALASQPEPTDLSEVRSRTLELEGLRDAVREKRSRMVLEVTDGLRETVKLVKKMVSELPEEGQALKFKERSSKLEDCIKSDDALKCFREGQSLLDEVRNEIHERNQGKLQKLMESLDPLLERIAEVKGKTSEQYTSLIGEREHLVELSRRDLDKALRKMEALLDKVALAIAEIDEGSVRKLEDKIREAKVKAQDLQDVLDISPILSILQKADDLALEGDMDTAMKMVERAHAAFDKLKEKKLLDQAAKSLSNIRTKMAELADKAMDTTPLQSPVEKASEALERKDIKTFNDALVQVNGKLELIRNEELRVEYHGRLMGLVNEINFLKKEGLESANLERKLEEARVHFHERRLKEAVELEKDIREEMRVVRLKGVLNRRLMTVEGTIKEAEGLLLDVEEAKGMLEGARAAMGNDELEKALETVSKAQTLVEDLLMQRTYSMVEKEIRQIASDLTGFSVDPGDIDSRIKDAYALSDDEKLREAMDSFIQLKDELLRKLVDKKAEWSVKELSRKIKEARTAGMSISPLKASLTKAKVLLDARDLESAVKVATEQIDLIDGKLREMKEYQSKLDGLRGRLLAYEVKMGQLAKSGIQVENLRDRIRSVRDLIESSDIDEAEDQLGKLEQEVNALISVPQKERAGGNVVPLEGPDKSEGQPSTDAKEKAPEKDDSVDPNEAYEELKIVIKRIQEEMRFLPSKGPKVEEIKKEIQSVQHLVVQKRYIDAYKLASRCYRSLKASQN